MKFHIYRSSQKYINSYSLCFFNKITYSCGLGNVQANNSDDFEDDNKTVGEIQHNVIHILSTSCLDLR